MTLKDRYKKHSLRIELIISIIITVTIWLVWTLLGSPVIIGSDIQLYANLAQIEATMLGFILATLSIVFTQLGNERFNRARDHDSFQDLWKVFINTILYLGFGVIVSWSARLFGPTLLLSSIVLWAAIISVFRVTRCIWVLGEVIRITLDVPPVKEGWPPD